MVTLNSNVKKMSKMYTNQVHIFLMQDIPYTSEIDSPVDQYYTFYMIFHSLEFWYNDLFLSVVYDLQR